jgi:hypothetical protein
MVMHITRLGEFKISIKNDKEKVRVLEIALNYLPAVVTEKLRGKLAIITTTNRRGIRLSPKLCNENEIILLSEDCFPVVGRLPTREDFRYFIFLVLHEVAHAYFEHKCPYCDNLTKDESDENENEATDNAIEWFNLSVASNHITDQKMLDKEEILEFENK